MKKPADPNQTDRSSQPASGLRSASRSQAPALECGSGGCDLRDGMAGAMRESVPRLEPGNEGGYPMSDKWCQVKLSTICLKIGSGSTPRGGKEVYKHTGIPLIRSMNVHFDSFKNDGMVFIDEKEAEKLKSVTVKSGDVLLNITGASIGRVNIAPHEYDGARVNQHVSIIRPVPQVNSNFIRYYLSAPEQQNYINNAESGATRQALTKEKIEDFIIPFPSLAEQKQIAARLDALLAQVDTLKTRLDAIPAILKRFRQSVLAAAVSGKLTEEWRGCSEYKEAMIGLNIPVSWDFILIDDVAEVKGGKRLPNNEKLTNENTGYPYIRAGQLKNGTVINKDQLYLEKHVQSIISKYIVCTGDVYITIVGACIGDAGIIPEEYDGANLTENAAKLCFFKKAINSSFLSNWLRSQFLQSIIQHEIKSGAQGKLALKRIKELPVPYTTFEEQTEIVRRVDQLFAFADQIEQRVAEAKKRVDHLTQSILAKAFRGDLTAEWREQNPDLINGENSAQALLERIKVERSSQKLKKSAKPM